MKLLLLALTVVLCVFDVFAQSPGAKVVAEFSAASCDEQQSYLETFAAAVAESPGSSGFAVFYSQRGQPQEALAFENVFRHTIKFLRLRNDFAKIIRAKPQSSTKVVYWVVPVGADPPKIDVASSNEIFEGSSRPVMYNTAFGGEACPPADPEQIADLMRTNLNIDLKVVVRGKTEKERRREMNQWLQALVVRQAIPRNRIRVLLTRKLEKHYPYQDVEFWFVRSRRG